MPSTNDKDFFSMLANGVGRNYAISPALIEQIRAGMPVVVVDRVRRLQAKGVLTEYVPAGKSADGPHLYDIYIQNLTPWRYTQPPNVNRFGVAILGRIGHVSSKNRKVGGSGQSRVA